MNAHTANRPANGHVTLHLLSLGKLHVLQGEMAGILSHRHLLTLYLVVLFTLVGLDTNDAARALPVEMRASIYIGAMGAFMLSTLLCFKVSFLIAARRGALAIHLSPILLLSTACSVFVGEFLLRTPLLGVNQSLTRIILLFVFHYLISELATAVVTHSLIPHILTELRGLPIRTLAESDPALWVADGPTAPQTPPQTPAAPDGFLGAGGRSFAFSGLMHLRADGNYVHLRSLDRTELLPGPLSDLVGQLPDTLGMQVHRSHWVATGALRDWQAKGRDITLRLKDGQTVPVAVTRRREVRDWLIATGLPQSDAP